MTFPKTKQLFTGHLVKIPQLRKPTQKRKKEKTKVESNWKLKGGRGWVGDGWVLETKTTSIAPHLYFRRWANKALDDKLWRKSIWDGVTGWSDVNYQIYYRISFTCHSQCASYGIQSWTQGSWMPLSQSYCILRFPCIYFKVETVISLTAKILAIQNENFKNKLIL
jgi:hypothetical protein